MRDLNSVRIGFLIHDVARLRRTVYDKALKSDGVTRSQCWVLANITRYSEGKMKQSDLARFMDMSKVSLGEMLDRLESGGYVMREPDPGDRRVRLVSITGKGEQLVERIQSIGERLNQQILGDIPEEDVTQTEDTLHRIKEALLKLENGE